MGLEMKVKQLKVLAKRHQNGSKKEKSLIWEELVGFTGFNLCYANWLLRNCGQKIILSDKEGQQVMFIGGVRNSNQ